MSDKRTNITPAPNGPLIVQGLTRMRGADGEIACEPKMALCRCGASQNKPFCDGAHAKVGFSSERSSDAAPDRVDSYEGQRITIHDNRSICAHAGRCTDGLPAVWRMKQEPWIDADGADVQAIIDVVRSCPSGALSYTLKAGPSDDHGKSPAGEGSVFVAKGGPYAITGDVELNGQELAEGADPRKLTLCRCGGSKCKPFCDGTHWNVEFDV